MRLYTTPHPLYCGIDLPARTMYVCILDQHRASLVHRPMQTRPEAFLHVLAPDRPGMVVAVECLCTWDWLADLCADEGSPFVLGHALSRTAIHGGKAQKDPSASQKMAALLRGGRLPPASVSPAARRATRHLRRRRRPLAHTRAALLAHVHKTQSQSTRPAIGTKLASQATRDGGAERGAAPAVPQSIEGDRARLTSDEARRRAVARTSVTTARHQDAPTLSRRHTVPGIGTRLRLGLLDDSHEMARFPRGPDCLASCRLVTGARASAGQRDRTAGTTRGQAHLQGAFAAAAVVFLRDPPAAQQSRARLENKHGQGNALTLLAPKLARAVSALRKRHVAFEREPCCQGAGRGAEAPEASLDNKGATLPEALDTAASPAALQATAPRGHDTLSPGPLLGPPLALLVATVLVANGRRVLRLTRA